MLYNDNAKGKLRILYIDKGENSMRSLLEFDAQSSIITDLGFDFGNMYKEADATERPEHAEKLQQGTLDYYRQLMETKEQVLVRFTGFRKGNQFKSDELFVIFDTVEIVYPIERTTFSGHPDAAGLLDKEYLVFVSEVNDAENRVTLSDNQVNSRQKACEIIREKLEKKEDVYLRGNIISLQRNGGKYGTQMAAYVNIAGLGIIGVIPIKKWSVGYIATESFRSIIRNNTNAIVNFKVCSETIIRLGRGSVKAFVCSRADFQTASGYNPWTLVEKTLNYGSVVKVRIVENGKQKSYFYGAVDGIDDFNAICFVDDKSGLDFDKVKIGGYYYGYVQKKDTEKGYLRIRMTKEAEQGSNIKKSGTVLEAKEE